MLHGWQDAQRMAIADPAYPSGKPANKILYRHRVCSSPMGRHPNPRLVKIHRSYTVEETARVLGKHKNTVRAWIKLGLQPIDRRRPTLIHGLELLRFVKNRRITSKRPCPAGHMFCLKCRAPRQPAAGMTDYLPISETSGNLRALCSKCGTLMHRRASLANLNIVGAGLDIVFPQGVSRIRESATRSVDCDSGIERVSDDSPQC